MITFVLILIYALFLHWLGDFVFQTDWMAQNKSSNWKALFAHGLTYGAVFQLGCIPLILLRVPGSWYVTLFILVNTLSHIGIDALTSRLNSRLFKAGEWHYFFVSVGFDQFLHLAILVWTLYLTFLTY
jgi:hypothetical protein